MFNNLQLPEFIINKYLVIALILSIVLDFIYPYHRGFLLKVHPAYTSYNLALKLYKPFGSKLRGVLIWFTCIVVHLVIYAIVLYLSWLIHFILWILICSWILKTSYSIRLLFNIVSNVYYALLRNDLDNARFWTQQIVRRNVYELDKGHVISACIESLFESLVDGYISPTFYLILLGPIGSIFQRIVNTLDSALGYKTPEFKNIGWFSAKIDTLVNYIPARLFVMYAILLGLIFKLDVLGGIKIWIRDRRKTESLNAGQIFSIISGLFKIRLEKLNFYTIGFEFNLPEVEDLRKCIKFAYSITTLHTIIVIILITVTSLLN